MPYQTKRGTWERSSRLGHVPIVESEFVKGRLRGYKVYSQETARDVAQELVISADELPDPGPPPKWALSFDGSAQEVAIREEYPSTRLGYIQIAGVLLFLEELSNQRQRVFVDPAAVRQAAQESLVSIVLPSSNVCRKDLTSVRESWRAEVFELFRDYEVEGQPILEFFFRLLRLGGRTSPSGEAIILDRCPVTRGCPARGISVSKEGSPCPSCGTMLYPTDSLRLHEEVQELGTNVTPLGRLQSVLEHLVMLCYLDYLLERLPRVLSSVALISDGPLALFGPQAPLKRAIESYLVFAARQLAQAKHRPPIVVGIEKTGQFAEHAAQLAGHLPTRTLVRLPDSYIYQRILTTRSSPSSAFGEDTYYGRKFFYKSATGQMLTITVPSLDPTAGGPPDRDDPGHYSTLSSTLALLDEVGTRLYEDALIPVALAHSYASIPLGTGSRVLTLLSRELLGDEG